MALVSRSTFLEQSNRKKVIEQYGVPVVDNEINEMQDIIMSEQAELSRASFTTLRNTDGSTANSIMRFGYAAGTDFRPYVSNAGSVNQVFLTAGEMFIDGYRLVLANDLNLTAQGLTFNSSSEQFGYVYVDLVLAEVDATADPTMATPLVGATTARLVFTPTWKQATSSVNFGTAFSTIVSLPVVATARIYKSNTARAFICRYHIPAGGSLTQAMVLSLLKTTPAERTSRGKYVKTFKFNAVDTASGTQADGMVVWDASTSRLQIGGADYSGNTGPLSARSGLLVRGVHAPDHLIANSVNILATGFPSSTVTGTVAYPDATKGWVIPDGSALGWSTLGIASGMATGPNGDYLMKAGSDQPVVYDTTTSSYTGTDPLLVQQLVVLPLTQFKDDPSTEVLAARIENDLVWETGDITRGGNPAEPNYPAFAVPGEAPSPYHAILASAGNLYWPDSNTLTGPDALERALNFSVAAPAVNVALIGSGLALRNLRFFLRGQSLAGKAFTYNFSRGIKRWGSTGEVSGTTGHSIVLHGEEGSDGFAGGRPNLSFKNPGSTGRSNSDLAVCNLKASTVILKNINFLQDDDPSGNNHYGYVLSIQADMVELENCTFDSGVMVQADHIKITGCYFQSSHAQAVFTGSASFVAQCLYLSPMGTTDTAGNVKMVDWTVSNNKFYVGTIWSTAFHAGMVLSLTRDGIVNIDNNLFDGNLNQAFPSIHMQGTMAHLKIQNNRFLRAVGVPKSGNYVSQTVPFNGAYDGAPILKIGSSIVSTAYISCTLGRGVTSKTDVHHNYFDMSWVGNYEVQPYQMWGGFIAFFNSVSVGAASTIFSNIYYENNDHRMAADNAGGWAGGPQAYPVTWGFYAAVGLQDGLTGISAFNNVVIKNNSFALGTGTDALTWRGLYSENQANWPASGGYITDGSVLAGIVLRNGIVSGSCGTLGTVITGNRVFQDTNNEGALALDVTTTPRLWFTGILLSPGDQWTVPTVTETGPSVPSNYTFVTPTIQDNTINAPCFSALANPAVPTQPGSYVSGIMTPGCYRPKVANNSIVFYTDQVVIRYMSGIMTSQASGGYSYFSHINANSICSWIGIVGGSTDFASDNLVNISNSPLLGVNSHYTPTGAANFTTL